MKPKYFDKHCTKEEKQRSGQSLPTKQRSTRYRCWSKKWTQYKH